MKIYIAGPITGIKDNNEKAFRETKARIESYSNERSQYTCIIPHDISPYSESKLWSDYMRDCIPALCTCDAIFLLPQWELSRGAKLEHEIAWQLGLHMFTEMALKQ